MTTPKQELNQALNRMKYHTNAEDLYIYKTPGGWYHVTDSTFNMLLSAPTARTLALCIDAYIAGYLSLFAVIEDRDQLKEENDQLKAAAAINEQAAALQLEAVANDRDYQKTLLENERAYWGKITRYLCAKLDNMTDALDTAERQNQADADNLTAVLEARYNAESVYIEKISDLMDENQALKEKLNAIQAITNPDQTQESEQ